MRLIELHILQSFPVTCLNRDDLGSPKSALFGGANRARLSSQCLKRAIRLHAKSLQPDLLGGIRTRYIPYLLAEELGKSGIGEALVSPVSEAVAEALKNKVDSSKDPRRFTTLVFLSPKERNLLVTKLRALIESLSAEERAAIEIAPLASQSTGDGGKKPKKTKDSPRGKLTAAISKIVNEAFDRGGLKDGADIALFGRMVADRDDLAVEGASLFGHALSTHKVDSEIDFFAAVDEAAPTDATGAAMTSILEFNSATYYRYAGLNLDMLFDDRHLDCLEPIARRRVVEAFIRAAIEAIPGQLENAGRKHSMNGSVRPDYVLGIVKDRGQPLQLINAFETPVASRNGIAAKSVEALKEHHESLKKTWNLTAKLEVAIPDRDLNTFCARILDAAFPA